MLLRGARLLPQVNVLGQKLGVRHFWMAHKDGEQCLIMNYMNANVRFIFS